MLCLKGAAGRHTISSVCCDLLVLRSIKIYKIIEWYRFISLFGLQRNPIFNFQIKTHNVLFWSPQRLWTAVTGGVSQKSMVGRTYSVRRTQENIAKMSLNHIAKIKRASWLKTNIITYSCYIYKNALILIIGISLKTICMYKWTYLSYTHTELQHPLLLLKIVNRHNDVISSFSERWRWSNGRFRKAARYLTNIYIDVKMGV